MTATPPDGLDPMPFSLDWLAEAVGHKPQLAICAAGHLVVRGNTCWQPLRFAGQALVCQPVHHPDKSSDE